MNIAKTKLLRYIVIGVIAVALAHFIFNKEKHG